MDLDITGKISHTLPFMAQLGGIDKLYDLARDKTPEARVKLVSFISSILEEKVSSQQSEMVADILIELMEQAEKDLRRILSERISVLDDVPLRLVLKLANDDIDIARPVLTQSSVLCGYDLIYIIKAKPAEYWQAIATRKALDNDVINLLADTKDFDTALALAENKGIKLTDHALYVLSEIAQGSDVLAAPLLKRNEVSSDLAGALYEYVGDEIKKYILENYEACAEKICGVMDEIIIDMVDSPTETSSQDTQYSLIDAAKLMLDQEKLGSESMLSALRKGDLKFFVAQFAVYTNVPTDVVEQMLLQANGQALAISCKAYGIEKQDFISIFMLTSKMWNSGHLVTTGDIRSAIGYYDKVTKEMALKIVKGEIPK